MAGILTGTPVKKATREKAARGVAGGRGRQPAAASCGDRDRPAATDQVRTVKNEECFCLMCGIKYEDSPFKDVDWIQCSMCGDWAHEDCTAYDVKFYVCKMFWTLWKLESWA